MPLRPTTRAAATAAAGFAALALLAPSAQSVAATPAPIQPWLATQLGNLTSLVPTTVLVHGTDLAAARSAVRSAGMRELTSFDRIGVVVATATSSQVSAVRSKPGVTYVEGNQPIEMKLTTSNVATRGDEARRTLTGANGLPLDGSGVSVAVIDSGVDPTHPFLREKDGRSAVVKNLKMVCDPLLETTCAPVDVGTSVDTDTLSAGGHGTHVTGIAAGRDVTLPDGTKMHGAAPGAKVVSLSTGAVLFIVGADASLNWVLENHEAPCGAGVPASQCPPIRVTNNSYGPSGGGSFDPDSATAKLQRALVAEGVVTVWANGNDGGDGSENLSNPPGQDPTPGIISVASYDDQGSGTRNGTVSDFSSRGLKGSVNTYPDISAPGEDIQSSCRTYLPICSTGLKPVDGGDYNTISGTSMATPHIVGIVAQLFQANPAATPAQIEDAIERTASKYADGAAYSWSDSGGTTSYDKGHGLVDVVAAATSLTARSAVSKKRR